MTTRTLTLTDFLLARIAEDEAAASAVPPLDHNYDMGGHRQDEPWIFDRTLPSSADGMGNWSKHRHEPATREHFERWDPARVLAECEAKRQIVKDLTRWSEGATGGDMAATGTYLGLRIACLRLAMPYADHPDFQEAWRV